MNIAEQIVKYQLQLKSEQDKAADIINKSVEEGRTLDEYETEQHKGHVSQIKAIEEHIVLLTAHEKMMLSKAVAVDPIAGRETSNSVEVRGGVVSVKSNLPEGIRFTRFCIAMAVAKGNVMQAEQIAKNRFRDTPEVANALQASISLGGTRNLMEQATLQKAAVAVGTSTDTSWAGPLVQYNDMASEFVALLRPKTIIGRMTSLRRTQFMMRAARQLTGAQGKFVGEALAKPVGRQTYDNVTLGFAKAAVIVVMSDELDRFSDPNAQLLARNDMIAGIAQYLDVRFMDPSYSGVANVSPASITNGATRIQQTGSTIAAIDAAVATAMGMFSASNVDPSTAVWVMSPATALGLSMKRTTQDEFAYPGITMMGGTWYGLPVITSSAMASSGSPTERQIALVTQEEVFLADDGGVSIDMSTEASVQMDDAPSAGAQSLVSLWQNNLIGIRAERYINWAPRRPSSLGIALIENVQF